MHLTMVAALFAMISCFAPEHAASYKTHLLKYKPAPIDNPLKGLVPYAGNHRGLFPHTMEFNYIPLSALVVGEDQYDWSPLEKLLNEVAARGHQTVFRVFLEYPGHKNVIPDYLLKMGLNVHRYANTNTAPFPPLEVETPDYEDTNLRRCLKHCVAALGKRYDGDPRIGFITAGLLGTWGEWHDFPHNELWASKAVQTEVMDAYESAFRTTQILLRYPTGDNHPANAPNAGRNFGYHDDSFAWATLDTGKRGEEWYFLTSMKVAGPNAMAAWKKHPIGGEIRPEAWGKVFDEKPDDNQIQDFVTCVRQTHVTWLMDSGMFQQKQSAERVERASNSVHLMGYEFTVRSVSTRVSGRKLEARIEVENRGVAPFYYDWPVTIGLLDLQGDVVVSHQANGKLTGLLPGDKPRTWVETQTMTDMPKGRYWFAVKVANPMPSGLPLRFANETQDMHSPGWLSLCDVILR